MNFPDDLSLQNFAMISYATSFWKRPNIQAQLRTLVGEYIYSQIKNHRRLEYEKARKDFLNQISESLKSMHLPCVILSDLINVIRSLGFRIICWIDYIYKKFEICSFDLLRNLNWTCYGTFDEAEIIGIEWSKSEENFGKSNQNLDFKYYIASSYILKNDLNQLPINKIKSYQKKMSNEIYRFILCSSFFFKGDETSLKEIMKREECSKETYMFRLAVKNSCKTAIWYYWKIIKGTTGENELINAALQLFENFYRPHRYMSDHYKVDLNSSDCLELLFMEMSENERRNFYSLVYKRFNSFAHIVWIHLPWPEEKFFLPLFEIHNRTSKYKNKKWYYGLLVEIFSLLKTYHNFGFDVKKTPQYNMFFTVFNEIQIRFVDNPAFIVASPKIRDVYIRLEIKLNILYSIFDIKMLDAIINSACDKSMRRAALCTGSETYKKLIEERDYKKLNAFAEVILKTEEERNWFREELLHFFPGLILKGKFHEAGKLLDWGLSSEEDKKSFKNGYGMSICAKMYFLETGRDYRAFNWMFPNDEDKKEFVVNFPFNEFWGSESKEPPPFLFKDQYKNGYQYPKTIRPLYVAHPKIEWLSIILAEGENDFIINTKRFFNRFFNSDEEVDQFKRKILNESTLKHFVKNIFLFYNRHEIRSDLAVFRGKVVKKCELSQPYIPVRLELVNKFLKFCTSSKNCKSLKNKILNDIDDWLLYFSKNYVGVDQMDDFLEWILKEVKHVEIKKMKNTKVVEEGKRSIINKFFRSPNATEFFENLVRHHNFFARYENRLAAWIEIFGEENDIENFIDLSVIESSLMNNYHWEYCKIEGMLSDVQVRSAGFYGFYGGVGCGCAFNIDDLKFMIETLKNKGNFEESYKLKKYGRRYKTKG